MFKFEEPGQSLEGKWAGSKPSRKYDSRLGQIVKEGGEKIVFGLSASLRDLDDLPLGTPVKVVYNGKEKTKQGVEFKAFDVFVEDAFDESKVVVDRNVGNPDNPEVKNSDIPF